MNHPLDALPLAVIYQAIHDIRRHLAGDAREFLVETAPEWLAALGQPVDPARWKRWVYGGCKRGRL